MEDYNVYQNPLGTRYASKEMSYLFSDDKKFKTWRKLWIALAEAEKELGLNISDEQIDELKRNAENLNLNVAKTARGNAVTTLWRRFTPTANNARKRRA